MNSAWGKVTINKIKKIDEKFKVQVEHMKGGEKKVVCPQEESVV